MTSPALSGLTPRPWVDTAGPGRAEGLPAPTHLLYLHGFRSSPQSFKARRVHAWLTQQRPDLHWWCPQLPASPAEAWALLREGLQAWPGVAGPLAADAQAGSAPMNLQVAVMGSSLGGFYATRVAAALGCRAVLLNPAIDPARDLSAHLGEHTQWHDAAQSFTFTRQHIDELRALQQPALPRPERHAAVLAKGDEVLDWREMSAWCAGATVRLLQGGDHALSDFDDHLPFVLRHLSLCD